jgi:hypothetical protein
MIESGNQPEGGKLPNNQAAAPARLERAEAAWRYVTQCLLGLFVGVTGMALFRTPWNQPIHGVNVVAYILILPAYFLTYSLLGYSMWSLALVIVLVMVCDILAFNGMGFLLHGSWDIDFIRTPLILLGAYLVIFVGGSLVLRAVRRLQRLKARAQD